jgi:hypothetical protein
MLRNERHVLAVDVSLVTTMPWLLSKVKEGLHRVEDLWWATVRHQGRELFAATHTWRDSGGCSG